ncbi:YfdQ family protein [Methylomonas sp. HYX-M1]|uniref:YfdQ family protein n=1 Tax=Methylomonas sp. HYX-M1 TaxID=3139307 RepID=UPI00345BD48E
MSETNNNIQAAIDAGRELATKPFEIAGTPFLVLPDDHNYVELSDLREHPKRIKQTVKHTTAASFIDYCNRFAHENSVIMMDDENNRFTAIFDYHGPDAADWGDHKAVFGLKPTVEWNNWKAFDGKAMSQSEFGKFIETNLEEIIEPTGAEMLEISLSIQAKTEVKFSQAQRLDNGQMQLTYNEEINGSAGVKGQLKIPQTFKIGLRLYEGGAPYQIEARLRYRIKDGNLTLWYELIRPHKTVQANLTETEELISTSVGSAVAIYHGTIS